MNAKHTTVPWTISAPTTYNGIPDAKFEIGTEPHIIATVHGAHYAHTAVNTTEAESNAQLIAAAPELLSELIGFVENCSENPKIAQNQIAYYKGRFREVIAKVTP